VSVCVLAFDSSFGALNASALQHLHKFFLKWAAVYAAVSSRPFFWLPDDRMAAFGAPDAPVPRAQLRDSPMAL